MAKIEHSVVINRPVEEVWAFMADPENDSQWVSGLVESTLTTEGPIGVGSRMRDVRRFLGRQMESTLEITEWEPNKRASMKSLSGPMKFQGTRTFESVEGGTRVNESVEAEIGGFFRLAEPLVVRMGKRQIQTDYANLKDVLESQG